MFNGTMNKPFSVSFGVMGKRTVNGFLRKKYLIYHLLHSGVSGLK